MGRRRTVVVSDRTLVAVVIKTAGAKPAPPESLFDDVSIPFLEGTRTADLHEARLPGPTKLRIDPEPEA
jgi:hypothetical protein